MLTGKQRAYLRAQANSLQSLTQIGKEGITDAFLAQADQLLKDHELVKLTVLETCELSPREADRVLQEALGAEGVQLIGKKLVIFRQNPEKSRFTLPDGKKK